MGIERGSDRLSTVRDSYSMLLTGGKTECRAGHRQNLLIIEVKSSAG